MNKFFQQLSVLWAVAVLSSFKEGGGKLFFRFTSERKWIMIGKLVIFRLDLQATGLAARALSAPRPLAWAAKAGQDGLGPSGRE